MIDFGSLRYANLPWITHPITVWGDLERKLLQLEGVMSHEVVTRLHQAGWLGNAADGANAEVNALKDKLAVATMEATAIVTTLRRAMEDFQGDQSGLLTVVDEATSQRFDVCQDGVLITTVMADGSPIATEADRVARDNQRLGFESRIQSMVDIANQSDRIQSEALGKLRPGDLADAATARQNALNDLRDAAVVNSALIPKDPKAAADWWRQLTDEEREMYVNLYPAEIGRVDGLPAAVRDQANRIALDQQITALQSTPPSMVPVENSVRDGQLQNLLKIRQTLLDNQNRPDSQQLMLLKFDGANQGKVVVSVGNPDTAKNVAVYVPGTTAEGGEVSNLDRMFNLQDASDRLTPGAPGDVATVLWLDYDAPDNIPQAMLNSYSSDAAPRYDTFINGLRAQNGDTQHVTAVGHSYGSVVIGDAARSGNGIAVNDIVVLGSPGMHVDSADDLHINPRNVWAEEAKGDVVPDLGAPVHGGWRFDRFPPEPMVPSDKEFGANVMTTDGSGHSDYWNENSTSLDNQARVVMGQYNDPNPNLRPELIHGKPPS